MNVFSCFGYKKLGRLWYKVVQIAVIIRLECTFMYVADSTTYKMIGLKVLSSQVWLGSKGANYHNNFLLVVI